MRTLFFIIILALSAASGRAQEKVVVISTDMFQSHQRIKLALLDEWIFKKGHNPDWASSELDVSNWKKFKPLELSKSLEDENGRIEGWFRLSFKLDSTFQGIPLSISRDLWAATDIYLNGELVHSFGDTGDPYTAYNPHLKYPRPIELEIDKDYVLAVHFVDYETTFTQRELRLKPRYLENLINLTGPDYIKRVTNDYKMTHIFGTLSISISFLLVFLFWFLVFLNPDQKIFKWIAGMTTLVFVSAIGSFFPYFLELSYDIEKLRFLITITIQPFATVFGLLILEWLLKNKITVFTRTLITLLLIANLIAHLFSISIPFGILFNIMLGYYVYLIYTNMDVIRGAQWAVVGAMIVPLIAASFYIIIHKYSLDLYYEYEKPLTSILILGAPLFLLAYISIRFRETLDTVTEEANKVLKVTEEKKELLENQNVLLEKQVEERTNELKKSLHDLQSTQEQLIQQEKLASLGQLTAGIAHEIKNPLNFVNNFSDLSIELIEETREELEKDPADTEEALFILNDIEANLKKIHEHGSRADSIVKSMLQHSRGGSGKMEPADLNNLMKEFVNLSFHGMRAGDDPINVDINFELDESVGEIALIVEDFSRVIINLCNNAFDALRDKSITLQAGGNSHYRPLLSIRTTSNGDNTTIEIEDNGTGMSKELKDKILEPFFTTKKGTAGTGLGLSITHDIIKAHGGKLEIDSIESERTIFKIII